MRLMELSKPSYSSHQLQHDMRVAVATTVDGKSHVAVYASSNGHWLSLDPMKWLDEIGYLDVIHNQKIEYVKEVNP